jgi:hypothetical protein
MDKLKGFKTLAFNAVMTIGMLITVWTGVDTSKDVTAITETSLKILEGGMVLWGIGNAWLRAITDSKIFSKR